jgi:hypothetical protein
MSDSLDTHYDAVAREILAGRVVPFLGAGVNLCNRSPEVDWKPDQYCRLPSGTELAGYLAERLGYPSHVTQVSCPTCRLEIGMPEKTKDLARVSQYIAVMNGSGPLYDELHGLFDADYPLTPVHRFFATIPALLRDRGYPQREDPFRSQLLIVTTNYDDLMERACETESFHLISYIAVGEERGKFFHRMPNGEVQLVRKPNMYRGLSLDQHPIILKIHGTVNRSNAEQDSFVITEDSYIEYLTHTDVTSLLPVPLPAKLKKSHLLFLGYGLGDWNLRVILHRIWGEQRLSWKSWAIQCHPDTIEKELWRQRGVDILDVRLEDYIAALSKRMQTILQV